jgi:hypothetical protein
VALLMLPPEEAWRIRRSSIQPSVWRVNSRNSAYSIVHRTPPQHREPRSLAHPNSITDPTSCGVDSTYGILRMLHCRITSSQPGVYCNPYCNRADTHWYTMDKVRAPDHRKPPKQAQFPDAVGQARTCASKLVAGAGVSGPSPLVGSLFCLNLQEKRKSCGTPSGPSYSNCTATQAWLRTILRLQEYIAYSLSR